ncbi:SDR family NAD(P)-dependent oxidoreductase [Nonomuraea mesophila]|uniref:SDR family NAD(P)-dependent oxidoreductase n=1 Tax=Nonomuraea mesophila TaxID=2530382 RepID=A0A4R5F9I4_9ACTN|nr:SDR family NAD(P)-dependent oxidoreductase [Nonomuraea mesophila]TDE45162.1 SDR family NAD(P)-dependent oxidoreductase [Nonomuraea mesophila]
MTDWQGSVAFITGGAQGIGLGIARALGKRGVRLALADIDEAALATAGAELSATTDVVTHPLDVRGRDAFAAAADAVEADLGPVNLLFNNAGIAPYTSLSKLSYEVWDLALGINVHGVVNGVQTFVPRMIERGQGGYVVNTASGAGLVAGSNVLYSTSKYAVVGLSESLKVAGAKYGIDVSVLCPGYVSTGILGNTQALADGHLVREPGEGSEESAAAIAQGVGIDEVGEIVIAGMEAKATWIHTDLMMKKYIGMRGDMLLSSFSAHEPTL